MTSSSTGPDLRYVVITRNSARWFGIILDAYESLSIRPFVLLDDSSTDGTEALLTQRGIDHAAVHAELPRVESMVRLIPDHVPSKWVIRLDDDELPSRAMRNFAATRLDGLGRDVIGFQRRWIRPLGDGRCAYSRHPLIQSFFGALDAQWRAFRPDAVAYCSDIHTPGFVVPRGCPIAPSGAFIAHFNWLVRTAGERRRQVAAYDRQVPNAGTRFAAVYLPEDGDLSEHRLAPMDTGEFDTVAAALSAAGDE
jgi:hypothetical protein